MWREISTVVDLAVNAPVVCVDETGRGRTVRMRRGDDGLWRSREGDFGLSDDQLFADPTWTILQFVAGPGSLVERLNAYRTARDDIDPAVSTAAASGWTQQRIANESGLSREGVRKKLDNLSPGAGPDVTPEVTAELDGLRGEVWAMLAQPEVQDACGDFRGSARLALSKGSFAAVGMAGEGRAANSAMDLALDRIRELHQYPFHDGEAKRLIRFAQEALANLRRGVALYRIRDAVNALHLDMMRGIQNAVDETDLGEVVKAHGVHYNRVLNFDVHVPGYALFTRDGQRFTIGVNHQHGDIDGYVWTLGGGIAGAGVTATVAESLDVLRAWALAGDPSASRGVDAR